MANVTRIKNNQITDSTITYQKIVPGTLVGSLFNANLTLNSNISIIGNLSVAGHSSSVSSTNTYVNDPLIVFNNGYSGNLTGYDIGILINRNLGNLPDYGAVNTAWVWSEAEQAFIAIATTDTGGGITNLNNAGYANVKIGNLTAVGATLTSTLSAPDFYGIFHGNIYSTNGVIDNFGSGNISITGGNISGVNGQLGTAAITNFSSGNVLITGGTIDGTLIGNTTPSDGKFANITNTSLSAGRVVISGTGGLQTDNPTLTYTGGTLTAGNLNTGGAVTAATGNISDFISANTVVTNFSTANVYLTGGNITGVDGQFGTLAVTNFSTANAQITGGNVTGVATLQGTTGVITNFSTSNAQITGGNVTGVNGQFGTLAVTNFSTANAQITGGSVNNVTIGATTAADGYFANLSSSGTVLFSNVANASSKDMAPVLLYGGLGVAKDVYIGGNLYVSNVIASINNTISVNDPLLYLATSSISPYDYEIGFFSHLITGSNPNEQHTGLVRNHLTDEWIFFSNVGTNPVQNTIDFTDPGVIYDRIKAGSLHLVNTTPSTSKTTGALIVDGGVGITGNIYANTINIDKLNIASINDTVIGNVIPREGTFTNLTASITFSSNNAQITGGNVTNIENLQATNSSITNLTSTNFSSSNTYITGGNITNVNGSFANLSVTNLSSSNVNITGGNITGGYVQITTSVVQDFSSNNVSITGGNVSVTEGNITNLVTNNFSSGNVLIYGGNINNTAIGVTNPSTATFTNLNVISSSYFSDNTEAISSNIGSVVMAGGLAVNKQIQVGGNLVAAATTASTTYNTGSIVTNGGLGVAGNVYVNQGVVVNENNGAYGLVVKGSTTNTLLWARSNSTYDQVAIGTTVAAGALVPGARLQINSNDAILLPSGSNAERPGSNGFSDVAGMLRFSTTSGAIEWYNGSSWDSGGTPFTVIVDQQFNGDDFTTTFVLSQAATTSSIIVSINGVVQIPTLAYAVSGVGNTDLVFTEAPATGDVIDVRLITSTQTVTHLGSSNGYNKIELQSNSVDLYTGSSSATNTVSWNSTGAQVSKIPATTIATSGVATTIDSFDKTVYRTAKYVVQASNGGNHHAQDALVVHDGTTATVVLGTAAVTSGSLGTITATISGSNVLLQFNAANNSTTVRIKKDYILI